MSFTTPPARWLSFRCCWWLLASPFLLAGCCPGVTAGQDVMSPAGGSPLTVESNGFHDLLPVDCLLPGKVMKLGRHRSFMAPRRPLRTTALDCERRGGEYVPFDRADYRTALRVWLESAQSGSPEAQYHVGTIYQEGLGREVDYLEARKWFLEAAERGHVRAQMALGYLLKEGLGGEKDPAGAQKWFRKAAGIREGQDLSEIEALSRGIKPLAVPISATEEVAGLLGSFYALVIGNGAYESFHDLSYAVEDARDLAKLLEERYGFEIDLLIDGTKVQMEAAFLRALKRESENLLVFFAGHGESKESPAGGSRQAFWLPVDASKSSYSWFGLAQMTAMLPISKTKRVLILADSCYAERLIGEVAVLHRIRVMGGRPWRDWFKEVSENFARKAIVSGSGPVPDHSPFFRALLKILREQRSIFASFDLMNLLEDCREKEDCLSNRPLRWPSPLYGDDFQAGHRSGEFFFVPRVDGSDPSSAGGSD